MCKTAIHKVFGPKSIQMAKFPKACVLAFLDLCFVSASVPQMRKNRSSCKTLIKIGTVKLEIIFSVIFIYVSVQALKHSLTVMLEKKILVA